MAVTLRLKRFGRLNHPTYRVVATDPRFPRDGRIIESLGYYLPLFPREDEQVKLSAGFDDFIQYFELADVNYHIGVVTTDMGTGGHAIVTCNEPNYGDDGVKYCVYH